MLDLINGRYKLQKEIGAGGMGAVFEAEDRLTGQTVALKRVRLNATPKIVDSTLRHQSQKQLRFVLAKEFQIMGGLRHPNIISVLDYGFDSDKQPFYTMTYLPENQTFLDAGQALSIEEKIKLTEQLLHGLAYLHRRGIVHRDIKPENVLVVNGRVKVLDFGLSHQVDEEGEMGGSPQYMAPEMIEGIEATIGSDLFAAGVLFYTLFAGDHPFGSFDRGYYQRLLTVEPAWGSIPTALQPILSRLLAKGPEDRYRRANDCLLDLNLALGQSVSQETQEIRESYLQAAQFVGREAEMGQLTAALSSGADGHGSAWLIGGESGVGKTRLLDEIQINALVAGFQVLRGQAISEGGAPFQVWRDVLGPLILNTEISTQEAGILKQIYPNLDELIGSEVTLVPALERRANLQRILNTIVGLVARQRRPTLLLLEDLHWAQESLLPITQMSYELEDRPLVIIGTYRQDERPSLPKELGDALQPMILQPFGPADVGRLAAAMLGKVGEEAHLVTNLLEETEGNVFFLVEILRAWAEEAGSLRKLGDADVTRHIITGGILEIVQRRLEKVPDRYRHLLRLAAIHGRKLDLPVLSALQGDIDLQAWFLACNDAMVLEAREDRWWFAHHKLREGLIRDFDAEGKRKAHQAVAEAIEATSAHLDEHAIVLANHWRAAENEYKEIEYALTAGQQLYQASNLDGTINLLAPLLERSWDVIQERARCQMINLLGNAYQGAQNYVESIRQHRDGLTLARRIEDQQLVVKHLIGLGWSTWGQLQYTNRLHDQEAWTEAEQYFLEAHSLAERIEDRVSMGRALHNLGLVYIVRDKDVENGLGYLKRAMAILQAANKPEFALISLYDIGFFTIEQDVMAGKSYLLQALTASEELGRPRIIRFILQSLTNAALAEWHWDEFEHYLQQLRDVSRNRREFFFTAYNRLSAILAIHQADFAAAQRSISLNLHNTHRPKADTTYDWCQQGAVALFHGDLSQLNEALDKGLNNVKKTATTQVAYWVVLQAGRALLYRDIESGARWLGLGEAHLQTSVKSVQERSNHVFDVIARLRTYFHEHLGTPAAQVGIQKGSQFSMTSILADLSEEEAASWQGTTLLVNAINAALGLPLFAAE